MTIGTMMAGGQVGQDERPPSRQAVIAETGRRLLDSLKIAEEDGGEENMQGKNLKRHISNKTAKDTEQLLSAKIQKVDPTKARKPGVVPKMWTDEEDEVLKRAIEKHGEKNWRAIAEEVPNRNYIQCLQRWKKALQPGLVKGHWSKQEDSLLLDLVEKYRGNWDWGLISKQIPGRNAKQCRERWFLNLDPSINRGPWTPNEDEELVRLVAQWGGKWSLISKHMPGRTENSVKTRFHSLQRKEARNRKWTKQEDENLIAAVLRYGRDFDRVEKVIEGRSKGQIKKRFGVLSQQRSSLMKDIYIVEEQLRANTNTTTTTTTKKKKKPLLSSEREYVSRKSSTMSSVNYSTPPPPPPSTSTNSNTNGTRTTIKNYKSSWMKGIVDSIADQPMNPSNLRKTESTKVIADFITTENSFTNQQHFKSTSALSKHSNSTGLIPSNPSFSNVYSGMPMPMPASQNSFSSVDGGLQKQTTSSLALLDSLLSETSNGIDTAPSELDATSSPTTVAHTEDFSNTNTNSTAGAAAALPRTGFNGKFNSIKPASQYFKSQNSSRLPSAMSMDAASFPYLLQGLDSTSSYTMEHVPIDTTPDIHPGTHFGNGLGNLQNFSANSSAQPSNLVRTGSSQFFMNHYDSNDMKQFLNYL